jgi:hypothetical protein
LSESEPLRWLPRFVNQAHFFCLDIEDENCVLREWQKFSETMRASMRWIMNDYLKTNLEGEIDGTKEYESD